MWPWEHLAVGYLAYTGIVHARTGRPPAGPAVLALAVGTQYPDLVDKPLAWTLGVIPTGTSLAHSLLVAIPTAAVVAVAARRVGRPAYGVAFAVGYLTHLPADAVYPALLGGDPKLAFLLYPVVPVEAAPTEGFVPHVRRLAATFLAHLDTPTGARYLLLEASLLAAAALAWLVDGRPGLPGASTTDESR